MDSLYGMGAAGPSAVGWIAALFFLAAGVLFIVRRQEVNALQKATIGARLPNGCAVAEGVLLILMAIVVAIGARAGWL